MCISKLIILISKSELTNTGIYPILYNVFLLDIYVKLMAYLTGNFNTSLTASVKHQMCCRHGSSQKCCRKSSFSYNDIYLLKHIEINLYLLHCIKCDEMKNIEMQALFHDKIRFIRNNHY